MNAALNRRSVLKGMGVFALGAGMTRIGLKGVSAAGSLTEINSGYSYTPTAAVSWRVVADTAQPVGTGESLERALGFVLANRGDLVITTPAGNPTLVHEGSSSFVPEGDLETQEGANGATVPYVRLNLVDPAGGVFYQRWRADLRFGHSAVRSRRRGAHSTPRGPALRS